MIMLFFCEECGKKNMVELNDREAEMIVFICRACRHQNGYAIQKLHASEPKLLAPAVQDQSRPVQ